jgi:hypothetical protein
MLGKKNSEAIQDAIDAIDGLQHEELDERKVRLAELKERFKLLRLYSKTEPLPETTAMATENETENIESEELTAVRSHLEPLGLAPVGTPVSELARLAALIVTQK